MAKIKPFLYSLLLIVGLSGCSVKYDTSGVAQSYASEQKELFKMLIESGIKSDDATFISNSAFDYAKVLANEYALIWPPLLHNTLINIGAKRRGLCFQWSEDMYKFYKFKNLDSVSLYWGSSDQDKFVEHNSLVVSGIDNDFTNGIVLDPWRDSGKLYYAKVKNDTKYNWKSRDDLKLKLDSLKSVNESIFIDRI